MEFIKALEVCKNTMHARGKKFEFEYGYNKSIKFTLEQSDTSQNLYFLTANNVIVWCGYANSDLAYDSLGGIITAIAIYDTYNK